MTGDPTCADEYTDTLRAFDRAVCLRRREILLSRIVRRRSNERAAAKWRIDQEPRGQR